MRHPTPRLAVIIVNYNTCELLRRCLQSVYASAASTADRLTVDVLVIDSASSDGSTAMVATDFPATQLIASPTNLGYTGGNNLGLQTFSFDIGSPSTSPSRPKGTRSGRSSGGEDVNNSQFPASTRRGTIHNSQFSHPNYVLLLNADTEVQDDALWQMANFLATTPNAGACGAQLHYGDGRFQHGAFRFPSLAQIALDFFPLTGLPGIHRLHNSGLNGRYAQTAWHGMQPFAVDFVLGAALMVRGEVIQQLGGLDDGYFMYCEELDWAVRMKLAGWQVYAVPTARVTHHEGQSSKQVRWSAFVRLWQSRLRFYRKYQGSHPIGYLTAVRLLAALGIRWQLWQVDRRFAQGKVDGMAWQEERAAYGAVWRLLVD